MNRQIILEADEGKFMGTVNSSVPQGSVLGPTLWNVLHDRLIRMSLPPGVTKTGFAADIAVVETAKTENDLMSLANRSLQTIAD